jgi:hypothetical protein
MDGGLRRHDVVGALRVKLLAMLMQCGIARALSVNPAASSLHIALP